MARRRFPADPIPLVVTAVDDTAMGVSSWTPPATDAGPALARQVRVAPVLPGEQVKAQVYGRKQGAWQARVVQVDSASADRVAPACAVFDRCGGCALQHLTPGLHLPWKQDRVARLMVAAGVAPGQWRQPVAADPLGYRRKARLGVRQVTGLGGSLVGFRERGGSRVVDMSRCPVLDPRVGEHIGALRTLVSSLSIAASVPQLELAAGESSVALVVRHLDPLAAGDSERLLEFQRSTGVAIWLQAGGPDTAVPLDPESPRELSYSLVCPNGGPALRYRFGPLEFVQVNAAINQHMVDAALELLNPGPEDMVLDLFCGGGNFSLPLARRAGRVRGLEGSAALVQRARANASMNACDNVDFAVADLYGEGADLLAAEAAPLVLLDPPRSGAEAVVRQLSPQRQQRVLYVACGPAALARDAAIMVAAGFEFSSLGVFDMFPQTAHVECMALFVGRAVPGALDGRAVPADGD